MKAYKVRYEIEFACQTCLDSRIVIAQDADEARDKLSTKIKTAVIKDTTYVGEAI